MSKRINVTVDDEMFEDLSSLADKQKRSVASLVTYFAAIGIEKAKETGELSKDKKK